MAAGASKSASCYSTHLVLTAVYSLRAYLEERVVLLYLLTTYYLLTLLTYHLLHLLTSKSALCRRLSVAKAQTMLVSSCGLNCAGIPGAMAAWLGAG